MDDVEDLPEAKTEEETEYYFSRYKPLTKYLLALVEEYPTPITQTRISEKTGVSKSAVNKIKHLMFNLCDKDTLAYDSKFVLNPEESTVAFLFAVFVYSGEPDKVGILIESQYLQEYLQKNNVIEDLLDLIDRDRIYFEEKDLQSILHILAENLKKIIIKEDVKANLKKMLNSTGDSKPNLFPMIFTGNFQETIKQLEFNINSQEELSFYLKLRDKTYFLVLESLKKYVIPEMKILKDAKDEKEKSNLKNVYEKTAEYYLQLIFNDITKTIEEKSGKVKLPIKYRKVGSMIEMEEIS